MSLTAVELVNNIRRFSLPKVYPVSTIWPAQRRSAVMIVLFVGNGGELRVVLTKRSRKLNNFSGHVSLPGGKADDEHETECQIARRESFEEIGLPYDEELNKQGLKLEYLNMLPCYLSRTFLSVRPVVYFLQNIKSPSEQIKDLKLLLNPGETSSIFSIPLLDLIHNDQSKIKHEYLSKTIHTYHWGHLKWPLKHFYYPTINSKEVSWLNEVQDLSSDEEDLIDDMHEHNNGKDIKDLWGLTAQMIYDLANIATNQLDQNYIGNENLIYGLTQFGGQMNDRKRSNWESGMIINERGKHFEQVLPKHIFKNIVTEFKL
ncbi:Peroxisomal coenzyme A diphosphatase 1,peroxisomal [Wickerhamomyces ciferrii]|uniref:Peroxisomal coenzyme A diphosphatase 1,peroxisomal n=1 Tax=Wickerhamomyces ciferrii (strain ATCC 14091 / BCRC 22168 / CBS 111 / JCM 3599 / NBRC 0793 / NRRL Y-1031 F-60-10) TaxID=1206466 RepID=K0KZW0_WICCF|nr:Peroxisomal coenzyme A diphosphatase 1,peroxisomal [Wickerhamomyces ciferrii]CCH46884.1 Peroxisomal coenzyme A diphosphatase 1,peroxisomal [Wickerhamomyces ciferrii]